MAHIESNLLSIEGIDGCGKSTQVDAVAARLAGAGIPASPVRLRAFGARTVHDLAERLVGDPYAYHPHIPAELREWSLACDIAYFAKTEILPALAQGATLVQDRGPTSYRLSAEQYEGFTDWVARVHSLFPVPRRTYLLDVPVQIAEERLAARAAQPRRSDESRQVLARMRSALLGAAEGDPRITVVDGSAPPEAITELITADWLANGAAHVR